MRPLRRMIAQVDADVLLLQEVGSAASLDCLNAELSTPYRYAGCLPGNSNRSIHLAVLSRTPVTLTSHAGTDLTTADGVLMHQDAYHDLSQDRPHTSPTAPRLRLQRDLLRVQTHMADGTPMALFGVHLKSRTSAIPKAHTAALAQTLSADDIRAAEARAVQRLVQQYMQQRPGELVLLAGDFNDLAGSPALAPLDALPLSDPQGERLAAAGRHPATYWPKRRMRFDRILLCAAARARLVTDSPTIHNSQMARTASDHYPVSLALD